MCKPNRIHIVPHEGGWAVKEAGNPKPLSIHRTQAGAIDGGRPIAQVRNAEMSIHRPNGRIREGYSYGPDPKSIKG
jgi:hypothetical protein